MVPFLHSVPYPLEQPRAHLTLLPHHVHNLPLHGVGQQARPGPLNPPPVIPLLAPVILHLLLVRHVGVHLDWLRLLHEADVDAAEGVGRLPRALGEGDGDGDRAVRLRLRFEVDLLEHSAGGEGFELFLEQDFGVDPVGAEGDHLEERVFRADGSAAAHVEEEDFRHLVPLEAAEFAELDHQIGREAVGVPFRRRGLIPVLRKGGEEPRPEIAAIAAASTTPTSTTTSAASPAGEDADTVSGAVGEGEMEEGGGGGGDGQGFGEGREKGVLGRAEIGFGGRRRRSERRGCSYPAPGDVGG